MIRRFTYEVTFHLDAGALVTEPSFAAKRAELEDTMARIWGLTYQMGCMPNRQKRMSVNIVEGPQADA